MNPVDLCVLVVEAKKFAVKLVEAYDWRPVFDSRIDISIEQRCDGSFHSYGLLKPLTTKKGLSKKAWNAESLELRIGEKVVPGFSINLREVRCGASDGDECSDNSGMSRNKLRAAIKSGGVNHILTQEQNKCIFNMLQDGPNKVAFFDRNRPTLKIDALIYRWSWDSPGHTRPCSRPCFNGALDSIFVEDGDGSVKNSGLFVSISNSSKCLREAEPTTYLKMRIRGLVVRDISIQLSRFRQMSLWGMPMGNLTPEENELIFKCLDEGMNSITFYIEGHPDSEIHARFYKLKYNSKVVIVDIDGTITKSNGKGMFYNFIGEDYSQPGFCELLRKIKLQGYEIIYLTARPVTAIHATRLLFADNLVEKNFVKPPLGPVLTCCLGRLHSAAHYVGAFLHVPCFVSHEKFKTEFLSDISQLFQKKSLHAAFGDTKSDFNSYRSAGIPDDGNFLVKEGAIESVVDNKKQRTAISVFPYDHHFPNIAR